MTKKVDQNKNVEQTARRNKRCWCKKKRASYKQFNISLPKNHFAKSRLQKMNRKVLKKERKGWNVFFLKKGCTVSVESLYLLLHMPLHITYPSCKTSLFIFFMIFIANSLETKVSLEIKLSWLICKTLFLWLNKMHLLLWLPCQKIHNINEIGQYFAFHDMPHLQFIFMWTHVKKYVSGLS